MIGRPEYTLSLPPPCPTNRDHLTDRHVSRSNIHSGTSRARACTSPCNVHRTTPHPLSTTPWTLSSRPNQG